jgi:cellulose synthase operon protein C
MVWPSVRLALQVSGVVMFGALGADAASPPLGGAVPEAAPAPAPASPTFFDADLAAEAARLATTRGGPEAIAPLLAVVSHYEEVPPGVVERILTATADASGTDPLVAAHAAFLLSRIEDDIGPEGAGDRRRAALGWVNRFWVVGPFGDGRSSFGESFGPERDLGLPDPARRYPGKEREVSWRSGAEVVRQGALYLDGLLRPDAQTAAYVVSFVHSERATRAALRLGSAGPIKVWVNGALVEARDLVRNAAFDQDAVGVNLRRGWNRILIKTVVIDGPWRLFVRLTDPAGRALAFTQADRPPSAPSSTDAAWGPAVTETRAPVIAVRALDQALERRAKGAPAGAAGAQAWFDLGRFRAWTQAGDREARDDAAALETAVARRPTSATLLRLAEAARDEDERRRTLERARDVAAGEDDPTARALVAARLGDVARDQHRDVVALARWRDALASDAACWPAALAIAEEEQSAGLPFLALARLDALSAETRAIPQVKRQLARLLDGVDRHAEADRLMGELAALRRRDVEIAHDLARRARARDDGAGAIELLRGAAAVRPELPSLTVDWARALEGAGRAGEARAALEALAARLPDDATVHAQLGKLLHRLGDREPALAHLRRALALRPQDPELRRYTDRVGVDREAADAAPAEDLARRYADDAVALVAALARPTSTPTPTSTSGVSVAARAPSADPAEVLLDRRVVRVHRNGLAETFAQRLLLVQTDRGAEDNKQFYVRYTPGVEEVEVRQARILRRGADGQIEILDAADRDDEDLSEPWYGLYYDNRAEVVRFEGLRAGDVLEVQYLVDDVSAKNQMADYFGDLQYIAEDIPKRRWDYTLIGPPDRTFYTNTPRLAGLQQAITQDGSGGEQVRRFAARDIAKTSAEPAMPGYTESAPYLHVSTYASWRDVGVWYWRLVEEQMVPDDSIRKAARSVLARGMSDLEKVRAIHGLVVTGTRYVGLEFGIHGFQPYKVTQVLARKFGDCKDKATLMLALLREAGIDAELVLLRTRRGGRLEPTPASLAVFDHAIVYVPKLDTYLDGTAEFAGTAELPSQDQGVTVLRVGPRGATLTETPVLPSSQNRAVRRWTATLQASGEARVTESLTITGQAAPEWREHYQTPGERLDRYTKVWTGRYPGSTLVSVDMPGIEDRNQPVTVDAVATVPRLGQAGARGADGAPTEMDLAVTVRDADFSRTYARLSERKEDLVIAYPWQHDEELVFRLPPGWEVADLPAARAVESPFGRFDLSVDAERAGEVRVRSLLDVTRHRIVPADYPRFRAFLGAIDAALAGHIAIRKAVR